LQVPRRTCFRSFPPLLWLARYRVCLTCACALPITARRDCAGAAIRRTRTRAPERGLPYLAIIRRMIGPASGRPFDGIVTGDAFDSADRPLFAGIDRMRFPVGESGLGEYAGLHGHLVLDNDFLAADRLTDVGQRIAPRGDDGDLQWPFSTVV